MAAIRLKAEDLHEVTVGARRVAFHVPSSSVFEFDGACAEVVDVLRRSDAAEPEALLAAVGRRHGRAAVNEVLGELARLRLVVATAPGGAPVAVPSLPKDALTTLVLNVTTGCNLSCGYCYKEDLSKPAAARSPSEETARAAVDLLIRESGDRRRINITFFGGEPLTELSLIRSVVEHAEPRAREAGKAVDFSLTTNGLLLDDGVVDYLDAHAFGVTVSMDGPAAVHDRNRRTASGQGSYHLVAPRARRMLSRYRSRPVGARVTLAAGMTDLVAIHDHLRGELGFAEVGFAPVTAGLPAAFCLSDGETRTVFDGLLELGRRHVAEALAGRDFGFSNLRQLLTTLHEGASKLVPCGAGVALLAVDADGDLHLCHRFTGTGMQPYGNVADGIDRAALGRFLDRSLSRASANCGGCWARHLCAGGCYHESYARHGDPLRITDHYCALIREWIEFGLGAYAEIMAGNPGFFGRTAQPRKELA